MTIDIKASESPDMVAVLLKRINELLLENEALKLKIIELEDRLNKNSSNSGLPTSKDIYRIEKKLKPKSDKSHGAQVGHKYNGYQVKTPDVNIDIIPNEDACACGAPLILAEKYAAYQKIEIPPIKPVVTEYKLHSKICSLCNKKYKARLNDKRLLGKNVESIISCLSGFFNNSKREVQAILSQIFNLDISLGLISNTEDRISAKLEPKYHELLNNLEESSYLHLDETSSNNKGKRYWTWVATNKVSTVFKLANSRGQKVLQSFLPEYTGNVISDRYAAYNIFNSNKRQICLAHLRRDFKRFAHSKNRSLAQIGSDLLYITDMIFKLYRLNKENKIDQLKYLSLMQKVKMIMLYYLKNISDTQYVQAQRVANNILKSFDMIWLFLHNPQIEPTNNLAERQIKHFVKYRKNSYFTWSERGDRFLERIKSLYATARLQNVNPFDRLREEV